ncbi:hypothetical protein CYY_003138 [Polysphondylium violaceum]|uniref:CoA-binding domain-containing protein n=1 Tax=Polysphondylium violaceum TaxID=133409 RepID=A0A8J4Q066_9MYCE|nr:hypothetical protein CYY_003138 [Polysphondylium violaceum]
MANAEIINILKTVQRIALVGASKDVSKPSNKVMKYLLTQGYDVTPVNPVLKDQELFGKKVYGTLGDIPHKVDMVDVFRNSEAALEVTKEAIDIKANVIWYQLGVINKQAEDLATKAGLKVVVNRCPKIEIHKLGLEKPTSSL